jgi:hypothetical protein
LKHNEDIGCPLHAAPPCGATIDGSWRAFDRSNGPQVSAIVIIEASLKAFGRS